MPTKVCTWPIKCTKLAQEGTSHCRQHNLAQGIRIKETKKNPDAKAQKTEKELLDEFFDYALKIAPFKCEECAADLRNSVGINPRTIVAHILKKAKRHGFPSVATNQINKAYLCSTCHTKMDHLGGDFIVKMKLYPVLKERVAQLFGYLTEEELRRVPEYYLN